MAAGVFAGAFNNDYSHMQLANPLSMDIYSGTGTGCAIAGRLSYLLDLRGPCVAVDTACSSSLTAIHLACQSLRLGESDIAIAGGVNLILSPLSFVALSKLQALAPDGLCKTFDARADGMSRAEGCGVVILKRLSSAIANGDRILAVVRGSAVNQDGRGASFTSPNALAQREVMRNALAAAGLQPEQVSYIEAHGTGTALGDPIEMDALANVYGRVPRNGNTCAVGSVKTNLGHLEAASGIAGLIKTVLALQHERIPPHLHFQQLNPHISLDGTSLTIPVGGLEWKRAAEPRRAGVSAFGLNGANSHVLLEESPSFDLPSAPVTGPMILPVSARSADALRSLAAAHADALEAGAAVPADICYTAAVRRSHHSHRVAVVGSASRELAAALRKSSAKECTPAARRAGLIFVFAPHGSQWIGMGRDLLGRSKAFRETIDRCDEAIRKHAGWSVRELLENGGEGEWLDRIDILQPTLFALQLSLAEHWRSWGIVPDAVVGHSMGETAAACFAGSLSLDDAARIACVRSALLRQVSGQGAMAVVELSLEEARLELRPYEGLLSVAVSNSPRSTVIAGDPDALEQLCDRLQERGIFCGWGVADVASHSPSMRALAQTLRQRLSGVTSRPASIPLYSTVTCAAGKGHDFGADYWVRNLCDPVLFSTAAQRMIQDGNSVFLEMSPHPVLLPAVEDWLKHFGIAGRVLPSMRRGESGSTVLLESLGALYEFGWPVDWSRLYPERRRCVPLPSYPWQRERFWLQHAAAPVQAARASQHPLLDRRWESSSPADRHYWEVDVDLDRFPYLTDHRIHGLAVLPAAFYVEFAIAAARRTLGIDSAAVRDIELLRPLILTERDKTALQIVLVRDSAEARFEISSKTGDSAWTRHVSGTVARAESASAPSIDIDAFQRANESAPGTEFYDAVARTGFEFGPRFRGIREIWRSPGEALARLQLPSEVTSEAALYHVHPAVLDSALQASGAAFQGDATYLPSSLESFAVHDSSPRDLYAHARLRSACSGAGFIADIALMVSGGRVIAEAAGLRFKRFDSASNDYHGWFYQMRWRPAQLPALEAPRPATGACLLLSSDDQLRPEIEGLGFRCVSAAPSNAYAEFPDGRFTLNVGEPSHFTRILQDAFGKGGSPDCRAVAYLWPLETRGAADPTIGLLHLVQAISQTGWRDLPALLLFTRGAQPAGDPGRISSVDQSTVWGLARTIAHEYPELRCTRIDLDPDAPVPHERIAGLIANLSDPDAASNEDQIAFRNGAPWTPRLVQLGPREFTLPSEPAAIRSDATYLITGGLRGLGFEVAKWIVAQGARHLVLTGRNPPSAETLHAIAGLEASGARIVSAAADVSNEQQMASLFERIRSEMPPLRGVVHSAVLLDDGLLLHQTGARFRTVFAPKIDGAWNLHKLTAGLPLDFFVLFSSGGSLLGSPGDGSYAAANAFVDALAHYRRGLGLPALTINWGAWSEVGLGAESAKRGERMASRGAASMTPDQGVDLFGRVLNTNETQIGVMQLNFRHWQEFYPRAAQSPQFAALRSQASGPRVTDLRARLLASPVTERRELLESAVRTEICAVLRIAPERIGSDTPLASLGFDSLLAVELRNRLENVMGTTLAVTLVWGFPTLGALVPQLASRIGVPLEETRQATVSAAVASPVNGGALGRLMGGVESLSEEQALAELLNRTRETKQ